MLHPNELFFFLWVLCILVRVFFVKNHIMKEQKEQSPLYTRQNDVATATMVSVLSFHL
jgi:hypothetical protein